MSTFIVIEAFAQIGVVLMLVQIRRLARNIASDLGHIYQDMHKESNGHKH
jgi:hypothetical protein